MAAVVVRQVFSGAYLEQYDQAVARMGMPSDGPHIAAGPLFHYVIATDERVEIIKSGPPARDSENFAQERSSGFRGR
jgi:hypothetical protein